MPNGSMPNGPMSDARSVHGDDGGPTMLRTSFYSSRVAPSLMYVPMWHGSGKVQQRNLTRRGLCPLH